MYRYSADPIVDYSLWDAEQERQLAKLPVCADCGEPIQQDYAFKKDGEWLCDSCVDAYMVEVITE